MFLRGATRCGDSSCRQYSGSISTQVIAFGVIWCAQVATSNIFKMSCLATIFVPITYIVRRLADTQLGLS